MILLLFMYALFVVVNQRSCYLSYNNIVANKVFKEKSNLYLLMILWLALLKVAMAIDTNLTEVLWEATVFFRNNDIHYIYTCQMC